MINLTLCLLIPAVYIYLRAVRPLAWPWWAKAATGTLLLPPTLRYVLLKQAGGSYFAPAVAPWVLYGSAAIFIAFLLYFGCVFAGQMLRSIILRRMAAWQKLPPDKQQRIFNKLHLALVPATLLLSAWGVHCGLAQPEVRQISLPFPIDKPLRIALLSDMHVSPARSPEFVRGIVRSINEQQPDIVTIVGDFVDGSPEDCAAHLAPLRELHAPLGVYGVSGNHDYYSGYARWRPVLSSLGIRMLDNAHTSLPRPHALTLAGITDESASFEKAEMPDLAKALRGAPADQPILLLAHRPIVAREAAPHGVRLQLSGHLHGGLVWGLGLAVAAADAGYRAGLYRVGNMQLYVTSGAGSSARTPLRLGAPTEIVILELAPEHS